MTPEKEPVCVCSLQSIAFNYYLMNFSPFIQKVEHMFDGIMCVCLKTSSERAVQLFYYQKNRIMNKVRMLLSALCDLIFHTFNYDVSCSVFTIFTGAVLCGGHFV